jgi:cytochrome c-type biogenesis protein CcmH/NrfG
MENQPTTAPTAGPSFQATHVYAMAAICLVVGLAIGYLVRGAQPPVSPAQQHVAVEPPANPHAGEAGHLTLEQIKQIADKQAAPLLDKLKTDPQNPTLLAQLGAIFHTSHQFKEAADYYGRAVKADPKNVALRTKLASSLFRGEDPDGAIAQLNQGLSLDPKDANSLFDLGLIKWQGKQDSKGALAAWRQLLKTNPQLDPQRKATVQKLIADVQANAGKQTGTQGAQQ